MTEPDAERPRPSSAYGQVTVIAAATSSATFTTVLRALGALGVLDQAIDPARTSLTALFEGALVVGAHATVDGWTTLTLSRRASPGTPVPPEARSGGTGDRT